ncbi:flagellar hook-associated protein FlgK [Luteimonas saliphila]|uniref:flagellar hook-associated protein FlgK n=1 Tax=Luteimonas saliphila TaxID=2804919 RepID=UPI001EE1A31F|nr:flagellar hook-associated protein FlgK [Luteimonas saliphila]
MTGMLSSGTSALLAFQRALGTVSHNVANASTPGYSRQRVELSARAGHPEGSSWIGQGVDVTSLQRLADGLVFARQVDSSGELGRLGQLSSLSARVDALVSGPATGLSSQWSAFFTAADAVAAEPGSSVARSQLLAAGEQLAGRWRSLDGQLSALEQESGQRLQGTISDANQLASEIAGLNRAILDGGRNVSPDLLDARALRVERLAGLVGAEAIAQTDGTLNVFTAGGQPLVLGAQAMQLTTVADPLRPDRQQIALDGPSGKVRLPSSSVSGELGGILEFRDRVLDPARAELGRLATVFATSFNAAQRAGVDYTGAPGADFFSLSPPRVDAHTGNTGSASVAARIDDASALKGQDLVLRYDGAWSATRADTGEAVALSGSGTAADPFRVAGVSFEISGTPAAGDRFALRPVADAAASLRVALTDPAQVAAASPLQAAADTGNLGNARAASARVTDAAAFAGFAGATIEFIDANQYTIDGIGPYPFTPGSAISAPGGGWSLSLEGAPAAGDAFTLARTPPRSTDNGNALVLGALDQRGILDGGSRSLTAGLSQLTARVGTDARHASLGLEAQSAIHAQVTAERESVSGVNLDEEAADLMRFQQAYQAAAQVISTADSMFQTLLAAVRR